MPRLFVAVFLLLAGACAPLRPATIAPAGTPSLAADLDAILDDPLFASAHWGVLVRSLATGETLYARNAERHFIPASALKVLTAAGALELLGPGHRFRTEVLTAAPVRDGILQGDLVVRGGGDPTISGRFHDTPRTVFRAWADSLRAQGIRRIGGAVVALDGVFDDAPFGRGWMWDDLDSPYAAEIGGLVFNEGAIVLRVHPSRRPGGAAVIVPEPASGYVRLVNRVTTGQAGDSAWLQVTREPAGPGVILTGRIPPDTSLSRAVAVREPARYFATALREALREAGIPVDGPLYVEGDRPAAELEVAALRPLFTHRSPPLAEILPAMLRPSQNLIAEMLLRSVGRETAGAGSAAGGAAALAGFLAVRGVPPAGRIADGSGLSTYNLVTPLTLVELLRVMATGPHAGLWIDALPAAGMHGTLANRLVGTPLEGRVRAKTGSMTGVRALTGYLPTEAGDSLVFAFVVNSHLHTAAQADRIIDAALLRLFHAPARPRAAAGAR